MHCNVFNTRHQALQLLVTKTLADLDARHSVLNATCMSLNALQMLPPKQYSTQLNNSVAIWLIQHAHNKIQDHLPTGQHNADQEKAVLLFLVSFAG